MIKLLKSAIIDGVNNFSTKPTRAILDALGCPDRKLKIIHIAGTNGKGSTAEFFTQILIAAKKKTGTFTSPEVYSFYDQFRINGIPLSPAVFEKYRLPITAENASEFEVDTAAAIAAFAGEGCEYAVIECGMGGKTDATNAIQNKVLAVITSVSLEHTAYLGGTLKEICAQKAGIINGCPAVINAHQSEEVRDFFKGYKFADKIDEIFDGGFIYDGKKFRLNTDGCLQPHNAACAIEGARILGVDERAIYDGIKNCKPRGRLERFTVGGREYILDGAHNPAAFEPLAEYLYKSEKKRTVIFGCLSDKDIDGNLSHICTKDIIAVRCPGPRARSAAEVAWHCRKLFGKHTVRQAESVAEALDMADKEEVIVCGSFTLLKEALKWIEKRQ